MSDEIPYLLSAWYVAALSSEVGADAFFRRRVAARSILSYRKRDGGYYEMHKTGLHEAFVTEDKPAIGAQQEEMGTHDLFALNPILLTSDAGNIRVRRKLKAMIEVEQASSDKLTVVK